MIKPAALAFFVGFGLATWPPAQAADLAAEAVLVMPFEPLGADPAGYWLREGTAILLVDNLTGLGVGAITRLERVSAFERLQLSPTTTLSRATVVRVGELVGATLVVTGSLELRGDALTARTRTIRLDAGRLEPEIVERGSLADLFGIIERVAVQVAAHAGLSRVAGPAQERHYPPIEAFEHYVKGLVARSAESQVAFLRRALRQHPDYDRARVALWGALSEQADHAAAFDVVQAVPSDSALARRARFLAALSALDLGRHDDAFAIFSALQAQQPAAALANNLGVVQLRRGGGPTDGLPTYFFTQAAAAEPEAPDCTFNLGYAYLLQDNVSAAVYWLRETVRRDAADADAHYLLGVALEQSGATVESVREKELARQLAARYAEGERPAAVRTALGPRGLERVRRSLETPRVDRLDRAILASVRQEHQELGAFRLDRGRRLYEQQQDREAIAELRRAVYLAPYQAEAHLLLGRLYDRTGRLREAVDAFKIAIWCRETGDARLALAGTYLTLNEEAAARAEVQRALVLDPASAEARLLLERLAMANPRGDT